MNPLSAVLMSAAAVILAQANDATIRFPALETTVPEPRADGFEQMAACAVIDRERLCGEALGKAWCRKQDYAGGFVKWTTADEGDQALCADDDAQCPLVTTITCAGVPIDS